MNNEHPVFNVLPHDFNAWKSFPVQIEEFFDYSGKIYPITPEHINAIQSRGERSKREMKYVIALCDDGDVICRRVVVSASNEKIVVRVPGTRTMEVWDREHVFIDELTNELLNIAHGWIEAIRWKPLTGRVNNGNYAGRRNFAGTR